MKATSQERPATVADVVDSLGLGLAQVRVVALALGVWFTDGLDICLVTVTTPTMAREFGLSHTQRGLLTTAAMLGVAIGCFGFFGDTFGRKLPIVFSYFFTVVMNAVTICATSFPTLFLTRFGVGIAMGVGMAPSVALMSETTPPRWRMLMAGVKGVIGISGFLFGNLFVLISDPTLVHLRWRLLFLWCSVPCLVLGTGAMMLLPESPAFLAESGRREAAIKVLDSMRQLNRKPDVSIEYASHVEEGCCASAGSSLPFRSQMRILFSPNLLSCTMAALLLNMAINVIHYNHNYGEPQVFTSGSANITLEPAVQLIVANCFGLLGFPITLLASMTLSRKNGIVLAFTCVGVLTFVFASTVTAAHKTWVTEVLFQWSMCGLRGVFSMSWNFVHQFSVEIYPVACSTTGAAAAIGMGRIGSILAPMIFEIASKASGKIVASYYMMGCVAVAIAFIVIFLVPSNMDKVKARAEADTLAAMPFNAKFADMRKTSASAMEYH